MNKIFLFILISLSFVAYIKPMEESKVTQEALENRWLYIGSLYTKSDESNCIVKFSPDDQFLIVAKSDISIYANNNELLNGVQCIIHNAHDGEDIIHISFSFDGKRMYTVSSSMKKTWFLGTWECISTKNFQNFEWEALQDNLKIKTTCISNSKKLKAASVGQYAIKIYANNFMEKKKAQQIKSMHRYSAYMRY